MKNITYYLLKFVYFFIGLQPFWMNYLLADFIFLLSYHIFRYRRKVVYTNLKNSFPEKNEKDLKKIAVKFYWNFSDFLVETVKFRVISEKKLSKHVTFKNMELFEKIAATGKSVIVTAGHQFNWEWTLYLTKMIPFQAVGIYAPLTNQSFERMQFETRHRWDMILVPRKNGVLKSIEEQGITDLKIGMLLFADQIPSNHRKSYWTIFLNQETEFFTGLERLSRELDCPVVFVEMIKERRGHYCYEAHELCNDPKTADNLEIVELFKNNLEKAIYRQPDNWLWSHRRWKNKRPEKRKLYEDPYLHPIAD